MKPIFKPGDRVTLKDDPGKIMTVQKYARRFSIFLGWHENESYLECTWLDEDGYKRGVFHVSLLSRYHSNFMRQLNEKCQSNQYSVH